MTEQAGEQMDQRGQSGFVEASRRAIAVGLWGVALVVLVISGALGTDDLAEHDHSSAAVAGTLAILSILVALRDPSARRALGIAFVVLVLGTAAASFFPGFQFVWPARSPEVLGLWVALSAVALGLLAPSFLAGQAEYAQHGSSERLPEVGPVSDGRMRPEARTLLWLVTGLTTSVLGYNVGEQSGRPVLGCVIAMVVTVASWLLVVLIRHRRSRRSSLA